MWKDGLKVEVNWWTQANYGQMFKPNFIWWTQTLYVCMLWWSHVFVSPPKIPCWIMDPNIFCVLMNSRTPLMDPKKWQNLYFIKPWICITWYQLKADQNPDLIEEASEFIIKKIYILHKTLKILPCINWKPIRIRIKLWRPWYVLPWGQSVAPISYGQGIQKRRGSFPSSMHRFRGLVSSINNFLWSCKKDAFWWNNVQWSNF